MRTVRLPGPAAAIVFGLAAAIAPCALGAAPVFQDSALRMILPPSWNVTGEAGEYTLESGSDVASLLLLPKDPDQPLEVRLAEIEEQFLSTGIIRLEASERRASNRDSEGDVRYRRYRLVSGPAKDPTSILLHQYSFIRSNVRVLLQVETPPEGGGQEKLFEAIHGSLEVLRAPEPYEADVDPFAEPTEPDSTALPDSGSSPGGTSAPKNSTAR